MLMTILNIDKSVRFHQIVKLKASSVIPTIRYFELIQTTFWMNASVGSTGEASKALWSRIG